jgi:hypothetical protein
MKKIALTSAFALCVTGAAFAQGTVLWNTIAPNVFTGVTNSTVSSYMSLNNPGTALAGGAVGAAGTGAGTYYYELLYSTSATSAPTSPGALTAWLNTGLEAENNPTSPGRVVVIGASPAATVPFTTAEEVMMVGWSANLGTTWAAAYNTLTSPSALTAVDAVSQAYFGESSLGFITPNPGNPGASLFGSATGLIDSVGTPLYAVTATPEPTTIALGVMGAASLLALRRKKA